jgi:hypothetical protein
MHSHIILYKSHNTIFQVIQCINMPMNVNLSFYPYTIIRVITVSLRIITEYITIVDLRNMCPKLQRFTQGNSNPQVNTVNGRNGANNGRNRPSPEVKASIFALGRNELEAKPAVEEGMFTFKSYKVKDWGKIYFQQKDK